MGVAAAASVTVDAEDALAALRLIITTNMAVIGCVTWVKGRIVINHFLL